MLVSNLKSLPSRCRASGQSHDAQSPARLAPCRYRAQERSDQGQWTNLRVSGFGIGPGGCSNRFFDVFSPIQPKQSLRRTCRCVSCACRGGRPEARLTSFSGTGGTSRYLLERCQRVLTSQGGPAPDQYATCAADLAEALELLQIEPEAYFAAEWNELWRLAIKLLSDADAIVRLKVVLIESLRVTKCLGRTVDPFLRAMFL